jgi:MoaA/NifB/PqqE/SkfB family radical SAM enzyme
MNKSEIIRPGLYREDFSSMLSSMGNAGKNLCMAPFTNLYFGRGGRVYACCYNRHLLLGRYPQNSLDEILNSAKLLRLRHLSGAGRLFGSYLSEKPEILNLRHELLPMIQICDSGENGMNFPEIAGSLTDQLIKLADEFRLYYGCHICAENIRCGNYAAAGPSLYEASDDEDIFPVTIEFEPDNSCNLECSMCSPEFSSAIARRNKVHNLLPSPYDAEFVEKITPLLRHIKKANFYGGEPFLIPVCYNLWEKIAAVNPLCNIYVQTNGTVMNERVRSIVKNANFSVGISIESVDPDTYSAIRRNAVLDEVLYNMDVFRHLCKDVRVSVCPIRQNIHEIPDLLKYFTARKIFINFNTVFSPDTSTLRTLAPEELRRISNELQGLIIVRDTDAARANYAALQGLICQIETWANDAEKKRVRDAENEVQRERQKNAAERFWIFTEEHSALIKKENAGSRELIVLLRNLMQKALGERKQITQTEASVRAHILCEELNRYLQNSGSTVFLRTLLHKMNGAASAAMLAINEVLSGLHDSDALIRWQEEDAHDQTEKKVYQHLICLLVRKDCLEKLSFTEEEMAMREKNVFSKLDAILGYVPAAFPLARLIRSTIDNGGEADLVLQYELRHPRELKRILMEDVPAKAALDRMQNLIVDTEDEEE